MQGVLPSARSQTVVVIIRRLLWADVGPLEEGICHVTGLVVVVRRDVVVEVTAYEAVISQGATLKTSCLLMHYIAC